jgi:putative NIF3 family GTP cyclohydrolase 1 type 2
MNLANLIGELDEIFNVEFFPEKIWDYICDGLGEKFPEEISNNFSNHGRGSFLNNGSKISKVYAAAFLSDDVVNEISSKNIEDSLLICKHPMEWQEMGKGFTLLSPESYQKLNERSVSVYIAHLTLDSHAEYSPTLNFARQLNVVNPQSIDFNGHSFAYTGNINNINNLPQLENHVKTSLDLNNIQILRSRSTLGNIVCVSGGGDNIDWLNESIEKFGTEITYITGIAYFRGNDYSKHFNKLFVDQCIDKKVNLMGVSHYISEIYGIRRMAEGIGEKIGINIEFIPETKKVERIKNNWGMIING